MQNKQTKTKSTKSYHNQILIREGTTTTTTEEEEKVEEGGKKSTTKSDGEGGDRKTVYYPIPTLLTAVLLYIKLKYNDYHH